MVEIKKTQCAMCEVSCGLELEVEDGKILTCRPDLTSPRSHGYACRKGRNTKLFLEHPDRLDYPLKRVGDHFERIPWDQAITEIGVKIKSLVDEYGPRAIAAVGGGSGGDQSECLYMRGLIHGLGGQYFFNPIGFEFLGNWWSHGKIMGDQIGFLEPDDENCEVLIFWGSNSFVTHQILNARETIRRCSEDKDRLLVTVDPRVTETARMSDLHIAPRPGTDALLMRAMIALILQKGWENKDYIKKHVADFEKAKKLYENVDIRGSLEVCNVPYEQVEHFCKILCTKKWGCHQDLGLFCGRHSTLNSYLLITLMVITGTAIVPGANIIPEVWATRGDFIDENNPKIWRTHATGSFPVLNTYPSASLAPEMLITNPERIRCVVRGLSAPLRSYPDTNAMERGLKNLDLYVVMDIAWTEDCKYADYVLPVKASVERNSFNGFQLNYPECVLTLRQPIVTKQLAERRDGPEVLLDISKAAGALPELPHWLYKAAAKAADTGDRMAYFIKLGEWAALHLDKFKLLPAVVGETLGRAMGSVSKAIAWAALLTSPMGFGLSELAGNKPLGFHPVLEKLPILHEFFVRDGAFENVLDRPEGAVVARADIEHPEKYIRQHIKTRDRKFRLWCIEVEKGLKNLTPEKEAAAIAPTKEYPFVISSGRHIETGANAMNRNPALNKYSRSRYKIYMNPEDVAEMGLRDGQNVRVTTEGGSLTAPVEASYQICRGYSMVPQQYGIEFNGVSTGGESANNITSWRDMDEITGNPTVRFVKCRIEPVE